MRFIRDTIFFGAVGSIGFLVDVLVLYSLADLMGLFYGRVISFLTAVLSTWFLNRRWTFRDRISGLSSTREFFVYLTLMFLGGVVNYATYALLLVSYKLVQENPIIGVAVGSLIGMFVNFITSRFFLFEKKLS